jgi:hypothetical protein
MEKEQLEEKLEKLLEEQKKQTEASAKFNIFVGLAVAIFFLMISLFFLQQLLSY